MNRLQEKESIFSQGTIQLEEDEKIPELQTKKLRVTKLSKKAEERVRLGKYNTKIEAKRLSSNTGYTVNVSMVPEEEALIQEEAVPAEKALFDKKEERQFDEASIDSGDTQSCSNFQQDSEMIEKDTQADSYFSGVERSTGNQFSSTVSTKLPTPAKELQNFSSPMMISKANAQNLLNNKGNTEDKTLEKINLELTEKKENMISGKDTQDQQIFASKKDKNSTSASENLNQVKIADSDKKVQNKLQENIGVVDNKSTQNFESDDNQQQQTQKPSEPVLLNPKLKFSLEKTNDFLKDLQNNPFLTNS